MRLNWSKWLAILATIGIVGLAVVSYQRFFVGEYFLTQNSWYQVIVRDGNLGLVRVAASFSDDRPEDFDLVDHILGWRRMPIAGKWRLFNRVTNPTPDVSLRENEFNCIMYVVATWPLLAVFVGVPAWRNRWRAWPLLREIIWPSDKPIEAQPLRRKVKRAAIAMAFLVLWLSLFLWVYDYPSRPFQTIQFTSAGMPTRLTIPGTPESIDDATRAGWELYSLDGTFSVKYWVKRDEDTKGVSWIVGRFGFSLAYRYNWVASIRGRFANATFIGKGFNLPNTTETSITFPLWSSTAICLLIVMMSFLRGPWRRHKCTIENLCLKCNYNLTGLVEPRCPECGTPMAVLVKHDSSDGFL